MEFIEITSSGNTKIKWLKKLAQKKYRKRNNEFIVENLTTIHDAQKGGYEFKDLFVTKNFISKNKIKFETLLKGSQLKEYHLMDEELNKIYSLLDTPSGITAVYEKIPSSLDMSKSVIYLDGIKDPGNMGNIMRSALAFDVPNIVLDETCVDVYNSKVINATKDALFKLNILEDENREWLKNKPNDLKIYVTDLKGQSNLSKMKGAQKFCLVLGNESHGVSEDIMAMADQTLRIKISDQIESLNVSAAAAILLYGLKGSNE